MIRKGRINLKFLDTDDVMTVGWDEEMEISPTISDGERGYKKCICTGSGFFQRVQTKFYEPVDKHARPRKITGPDD